MQRWMYTDQRLSMYWLHVNLWPKEI